MSGRVWDVVIDEARAFEVREVEEVEIHANGALVLMDEDGAWLAVFAPGAWRSAMPAGEAEIEH